MLLVPSMHAFLYTQTNNTLLYIPLLQVQKNEVEGRGNQNKFVNSICSLSLGGMLQFIFSASKECKDENKKLNAIRYKLLFSDTG